jgi:hypothetical protein
VIIAPTECTPGIDWLTVRTEANPQSQDAYARARQLQEAATATGDQLRDWGTHGYIGKATRHCRWGVKGEEVLVELSGPVAQDHWRSFVHLASTIPRLDTKVDVRFPHPVADLALEAYRAPGVRINDRLPPIAKALYTGTAGGQTCYVGAMGGRRLGRLYDKSAESPRDTPANVWRWELQERRPFSDVAGRALDRHDDVRGAVAAYVHRYFARHGIQTGFGAGHLALPDIPRRRQSDLSAWRDWAIEQVLPGVRRWLAREDARTVERLLRELGGGDA